MALVMAIYETVGGMRGVAWTDVLQGVMLLLGIGTLAIIQVTIAVRCCSRISFAVVFTRYVAVIV